MKIFFISFGAVIVAGAMSLAAFFFSSALLPAYIILDSNLDQEIDRVKSERQAIESRVRDAYARSANVKALYMTADVASDQGAGATRLRNHLIKLAETTEINGFVIDVKEVCGADYNEDAIRNLIAELRKKNIWSIARIVVMKDASQIEVHPEWYLTRASVKSAGDECSRKRHLRIARAEGKKPQVHFWRDKRGGYWVDPASLGVREYIADFSKRMIDLGFDELQFDYIRFPSDGDVENAIYPAWNGANKKYFVMKDFFEYLNRALKEYKPEIILSADLFGYAAILAGDVGIGQRLEDVGDNFDYISFMVYPSHYYSGLYLPADSLRGLPSVNFNRFDVRAKPDTVVGRSLFIARDFLDGKISYSTGTAQSLGFVYTNATTSSRSKARLRPWLEDFFHEQDAVAGRPHGITKVRLQIDAAENSENYGWMLWNAANVYTEGALKKE